MYRKSIGAALFMLAASLSVLPAHALAPDDTIRIVVPYSPGGGYDAQARLAAPYIQDALREQGLSNVNVIVENVTGGAGAVATASTYTARADGKTVLFLDPESSIWQQALGGAPFEVDRFEFIAQMSVDPMLFMVRSDLGLSTFDEVVARSQEQPILIGTAGKGGHDHIMPVILQHMLNDSGVPIEFDYLHLDGTAPMLASMRRGEAEGALEVPSIFGPAEAEGELIFLFHFMDAEGAFDDRWPHAKEVIEVEQGLLDMFAAASNYRRVFVAPPGTAPEVMETLGAAFQAALAHPELRTKADESNRPIVYLGPEDIARAIALEAELARTFAPLIEDSLD